MKSKRTLSITLLFLLAMNANCGFGSSIQKTIDHLGPTKKLQGKKLLDSLLVELPKAKEDTNKVNILIGGINVGIYQLIYINNLKNSLKYVEDALELSKKLQWKIGIGRAYYNLGDYYLMTSDYPKSLENSFKALKIFEEINDEGDMSLVLNSLAAICEKQRNFDKSLEYSFKALKFIQKRNQKRPAAICYGNIYDVYYYQQNYDKALEYGLIALKAVKLTKDNDLTSIYLMRIGNIYTMRSEMDKALEYYLSAMKLPGISSATKATIYSNIGVIYCIKSDNVKSPPVKKIMADSAFKYLISAADTLLKIGGLNDAMTNYNNIYTLEASVGDYKKAFEYYKNYIQLKDSIFSLSNTKKIAALEMKRVEEVKGKEIEVLKKEKEVTLLEAKHSIFQRNIFIAGGGFLFLLSILLLIGYKREVKSKNLVAIAQGKAEEKSKLLEESNSVKDKLFSVISHDLRSPLNDLDATLKLLDKDSLHGDDLKKVLSDLDVSFRNTLNLLDNLLIWSLTKMRGEKQIPELVDMKEIAKENMILFVNIAGKKNITLKADIPDKVIVYTDKNMVRLVLRNLLSNAIKFSNPGSEILVNAHMKEKTIEFSVKDEGTGISADKKNELFSLGKDHIKTGMNSDSGTGLGLALCHELVIAAGGSIRVESELGKGSTFYVDLPAIV